MRLLGGPALIAVAMLLSACAASPAETYIRVGGSTSRAADLAADDDVYYSVTSSYRGGFDYRTEWDAHFLNVPRDLRAMRINYAGKISLQCHGCGLGETQTISIYNPTTMQWVVLDPSRAMGETEVAVSNLTPPGNATDYVGNPSGPGDVWVKVQTDGLMTSSDTDLLQLVVAE